MKISNETKVGVLAIVAITLLILGFNFLKGKTLFARADVLYAVFDNVGPLDKANPVKINGFTIGTVYDLTSIDKEVNGVRVTIHLSQDVDIPKNSIATISSPLVGSSFIEIAKGPSNEYLKPGDTISTEINPGLISDLKTQLTPTISRVNEAVDSLKIMLGTINSVFDPNTNQNLQTMIGNLAVSSHHLQRLLNTESGMLGQSLQNMNSVTGNLAKSNDQVTATLQNLQTTSTKLANARIEELIAVLEGTIGELKTSVSKIHSNDGSLGKLLNDKTLYDNLNGSALRLQMLLDDLRINPKRYVNISLIGRKDKDGPITSPVPIDTLFRQK